MRESVIEAALTGAIRKAGGQAIKLVAAGENGWPDRLCLLPGGVLAFAELKAPGKKATALQLHRIKTLQDLGFVAEVLDSRTTVLEFVKGLSDGNE
jgi:hypothetical protein